jgi:hypothetical protein
MDKLQRIVEDKQRIEDAYGLAYALLIAGLQPGLAAHLQRQTTVKSRIRRNRRPWLFYPGH